MLDDAIHFKQLEMLERAVDLVETKRATRHMYAKVMEAKDTIERLKSISKMMHKVLSLDQRTIAEIRGYSNPSPEIHAVMKATLLLLGHYEEETRVKLKMNKCFLIAPSVLRITSFNSSNFQISGMEKRSSNPG